MVLSSSYHIYIFFFFFNERKMGRERQSKLEFSPGQDHHHMILYIKTFIFFKELFISEVEICNDKQST